MFNELAKLFSNPLRIKLIKFFALQPDARFLAAQVAPVVGAPRARVQSELASLARLGALGARRGKGGVHYQWGKGYSLATVIHAFISEATLPNDKAIVDLFRRIPSVALVIAAGILAGETRSSVDLLVVTRRPKDPRIAAAARKLELLSAVPIRFTVMAVKEYEERTQAYDRLLRDIMDFRHRVVLGRISGRSLG